MSHVKKGTTIRKIYELIKEKKRMSIDEIRDSTSVNYNTIRSSVIDLTNLGLVERVARGVYEYKSKRSSE